MLMDNFHPQFTHSHRNGRQRLLTDMAAMVAKQSFCRADVSEKKGRGSQGGRCGELLRGQINVPLPEDFDTV